ncbi:hypothetical protein JTB14_006035 [Gonioctena quinquepunctata]|nr:hypothetical protein JTB14_006035 [Gonioctena quinquepunctata]
MNPFALESSNSIGGGKTKSLSRVSDRKVERKVLLAQGKLKQGKVPRERLKESPAAPVRVNIQDAPQKPESSRISNNIELEQINLMNKIIYQEDNYQATNGGDLDDGYTYPRRRNNRHYNHNNINRKPEIPKKYIGSSKDETDFTGKKTKEKSMFYTLGCELLKMYPDIMTFTWNYHEVGHGKGAPDGIGATCQLITGGGDITDLKEFATVVRKRGPSIQVNVIEECEIDQMNALINKNSFELDAIGAWLCLLSEPA